ncbi:MAG: gamma-glutamyl kinase [Verrucomicrobiota bacterium]
MLVFWKERLTFLAVPKTGSTAYADALEARADIVIRDPPHLKHSPVFRYNRFFRPMFEKQGAPDMQTLAVMREPISWLSSWYRYRARPFMDGKANSTAGISFDDFVLAYCKGDRPGFADVGNQAKFLEPRPNGTVINHLYRYDDVPGLNSFLEMKLDITLEVGFANVSPKLATPLSPQVEEKLRRKFDADFSLYQTIPDGGLHAG